MTAVLAAVLVALPIAGCRSASEQEARAEAAELLRAVEQLRTAANDQKAPFLHLLQEVPCSESELCNLKRRCVAAYELHQGALDGLSALRREISRSTDPIPESAAEELGRTERDLLRAKELSETCAELEGAARRRYDL